MKQAQAMHTSSCVTCRCSLACALTDRARTRTSASSGGSPADCRRERPTSAAEASSELTATTNSGVNATTTMASQVPRLGVIC